MVAQNQMMPINEKEFKITKMKIKKEREIYKRRKLRSHLAECGKNRTNS
jgi:hypothetical protein